MGTGYTRADTGNNIADGNIINAADLDGEFDAVQAAFNASTGHTHDGTTAEGAPIAVTGPTQEYVSTATELRPKTNNTYDLGSATNQWKDLYVDGTANLDAVDIDGGNIDGTVIGAATPAAGTFTTAAATTGNITTVNATTVDTTNIEVTNLKAKDGTASAAIADSTGVMTVASLVATTADINGGTIDGVTIGGSTPTAGTFTTTTATTGNITTVNATTVDTTNLEVTSLKAKDGTAAGSIANSTGVVTFASSVLTTADINGGTIDGVTIGGAVAGAITGTTGTFSGDLSLADKIIHSGDTNTAIRFPANDTVTVETSGSERMRITSTGSVGIGTSTPATFLHLQKDTLFGIRLERTGASPSICNVSNEGSLLVLSGDTSGVAIFTGATPTEKVRVDSTGRLGIGTIAPDVGLHYTGDTPKLRIESTNSLDDTAGTEEIGRIEWEAARGTNRNVPASIRVQQAGTWSTVTSWLSPTSMAFYTQDNSGVEVTSPRLFIGSTGNVGIGTSTPATPLDVNGDVTIADKIIHSGDTNTAIRFPAADTVTVETAGSERMRIDSAGNVGINETAPDYKLDVNGSFGFTPGVSVTPVDNGDVVFELTDNTTLTVKAKGSDGVVRSGIILLV